MDEQDNPPTYEDVNDINSTNEEPTPNDSLTVSSTESSSRNSLNLQNENEYPNNSTQSNRNSLPSNSNSGQHDKTNGHKTLAYTDSNWDSKYARSLPDLSLSMSELEINKLRNNSTTAVDDARRKLSDQPATTSLQKSRSNSGTNSGSKPGNALAKSKSPPKSSPNSQPKSNDRTGSQGNFKALKSIPSTLIHDIIGKDDKEINAPVTSGNAKRMTMYSIGIGEC